MKNHTLILSLFIFHFSLCSAQDTLVYKTGEKVVVKVIAVRGDSVIYKMQPGEKNLTINQSELYCIRYESGTKFILSEPAETNSNTLEENTPRKFFIGIKYGWILPTGILSSGNNKTSYPYPNGNSSAIIENEDKGIHKDVSCGYNFYGLLKALLLVGEDANVLSNTGPYSSANSSKYYVWQYLAGIAITTDETKHDLSLCFCWLIGMVTADYPSLSYTENLGRNSGNYTYTVSLSNGRGLENYPNITLEYNPVRILSISLNIGYMFDEIKYSNSSTSPNQTYTNPVTLSLNAYEINLGLSFHFLKKR